MPAQPRTNFIVISLIKTLTAAFGPEIQASLAKQPKIVEMLMALRDEINDVLEIANIVQ